MTFPCLPRIGVCWRPALFHQFSRSITHIQATWYMLRKVGHHISRGVYFRAICARPLVVPLVRSVKRYKPIFIMSRWRWHWDDAYCPRVLTWSHSFRNALLDDTINLCFLVTFPLKLTHAFNRQNSFWHGLSKTWITQVHMWIFSAG